MKMKVYLSLIMSVIVVAALVPAWAQAPARSQQELQILSEIGMQIGQSMQALTSYSFQQRTAVTVNGEDKGVTLVQIAFGPDNRPITTTLSAPPPPDLGRGPLRRAMKEDKIDEMKDTIEQIVQLSNSYLMLNQEKLAAIGRQAQIWMTPGGGEIRLVASGMQQPGDQVTITSDGQTRRQTKTEVQTSVFGGPMTVVAQYQQLPAGLNYNAQTNINVPAKGIQIVINTMNYIKQR
jgi:hypothetical protein